jgi:recombination protein RecA
MALNYVITGSLSKGVPNRRTGCIAGPQGSGKSLLLGNIAKAMQDEGYHIFYFDSENAIDEEFLARLNVDMSDEKFTPIRVYSVEEAVAVFSDILREFDKDEKVAVIVDSLSNLELEAEIEKFEKEGELANDMGRKAKSYKQFVQNVNSKVGDRDMFFWYSLHVYENQNVMNGEGKFKVSGGNAQLYIPSISIMLDKLNLKEGTKQTGIKMKVTTKKTRYNQLGVAKEILIPYATGIDPYDGVPDILADEGIIQKNGGWFTFIDENGKEVKFQKKTFSQHADYLITKFNEAEIKERDDLEVLKEIEGEESV